MKLSSDQAVEALVRLAAGRGAMVSISVDQFSEFLRDRTVFRIVVENETLERYAREGEPEEKE